MAAGNLTIQGTVSGGPDGGRTFGPAAITSNAALAYVNTVALGVGANTITVPTGMTCMVIWPPNATAAGGVTPNPPSSTVLTLKGVSGDTGVPISNKWPTELAWDTPPSSFVINSTTTATVVLWGM